MGFTVVSPMPLPSRDAPPFGLGLAPRHDLVGRIRDRVVRRLALGALERMMASHMNPVRNKIGLPPVRTLDDVYLAADVVLAFTAEPFEYPRSDWPAKRGRDMEPRMEPSKASRPLGLVAPVMAQRDRGNGAPAGCP